MSLQDLREWQHQTAGSSINKRYEYSSGYGGMTTFVNIHYLCVTPFPILSYELLAFYV